MSQSANYQYPGAPSADVFANSQAQGSALVVDTTTDELYYYKENVGPTKIRAEGGWTYIQLTADFTVSSTTPADIPGFSFTPDPSATYIVEGHLLLQGSSTGLGVCPGVSWPSGLLDGVMRLSGARTGSAEWLLNNNYSANESLGATSNPAANTSYLSKLDATFLAGPAVANPFKLTLARG